MRTYVGTVTIFNGRYPKKTEVRLTSSNFSAAMGAAYRKVIRKKGERIESVQISLRALPQTREDSVRVVEKEEEGPWQPTDPTSEGDKRLAADLNRRVLVHP
jgi:hypothetical protein